MRWGLGLPAERYRCYKCEWWRARPGMAARRVDGVRRPLVPRAALGDGSRVGDETPSSRRRHFCRPTRSTDGAEGLAAPRRYVGVARYGLAGEMIIRCFKRKRAHFDAPGSLWTHLLWVLKRRGARAAASVLTPPPEPQLAPHTKRAKQHKRSGTLDDPLRRRRGTRRRTTQAAPRRRRVQERWTRRASAPTTTPARRASTWKIP